MNRIRFSIGAAEFSVRVWNEDDATLTLFGTNVRIRHNGLAYHAWLPRGVEPIATGQTLEACARRAAAYQTMRHYPGAAHFARQMLTENGL